MTADGRVSSSELTRLIDGCRPAVCGTQRRLRRNPAGDARSHAAAPAGSGKLVGHARGIQAAATESRKHRRMAQRDRRLGGRHAARVGRDCAMRHSSNCCSRKARLPSSCAITCHPPTPRRRRKCRAISAGSCREANGRGRSGSTGGIGSRRPMVSCQPLPARASRSASSVAWSCWAPTSAPRRSPSSTRWRCPCRWRWATRRSGLHHSRP